MTTEEIKRLENAIQSAKSAHHRIDRLNEEVSDLHKLTEAMAVTANNVERLQNDVTEIKDDIKALSAVPANRWNAAVGYVLAALASGVVGALLGGILR
ncbi:MAG: hypothetical protein IJB27_01560 [Clostridia bacterium]|nr:hypothetical protein [Clostridia bacterium]